MKLSYRWYCPVCLGATAAMLIAGCETTGQKPAEQHHAATDRGATARGRSVPVTIDTAQFPTLGPAIRQIGESAGGSAVLMSGMEDWLAPDNVQIHHSDLLQTLKRLGAPRNCQTQVTPDYIFLYPPGYEALESLSLADRVDPRFQQERASFAVGAGTDLFNALALLSASLNSAIVADNLVADTWCGELFLEDAPVPSILEALLKSARVLPAALDIQSTPEYILLRSTENANRAEVCLNRNALTPAQTALLQRQVSIQLPSPSNGATFGGGPKTLADTLSQLSSQIGMPVTADPAMARLPVNVAVIRGVSLETALNLIVWQWPVPQFGYRVGDGAVHFCLR